MYSTVLQYLEETERKYPDKVAFQDTKESYTFHEFGECARKIGSSLLKRIDRNQPVVVYMEKRAYDVVTFMGVVYSGCFYVPIDAQMPLERIELILNTLQPKMIIYDDATSENVKNIAKEIPTLYYKDAIGEEVDSAALSRIRKSCKTTDLLYVLFTSGSTGVPKGVTISHGAVIDFMEWIVEKYEMDENTTLCNQAPFYFDASVPDLYIPLKTGATVYIPPKTYYTFPKKILQYIDANKINTLVWVPSALCNVVNCKAFEVCVPTTVRLVIFCGEVMPCKHLNVWRMYIPDALYVNMYGPTEATYACMYYNIEKSFEDDEKLPLGKACENSEILLLNDADQVAKKGEIGEICILGQCLSQGYYNNWDRTQTAFVQNPVNPKWIEYMYRTGDLAFVDENDEMVFAGRKDFQIKKLGHRIELGEIENAILSLDAVENACCVFHEEKSEIIALYTGRLEPDKVQAGICEKLPHYMLPDRFVHLDAMPMNLNGKIDRPLLKKKYTEE